MYCQNCGKEIDDKAEICVGCGVRVNPPNIQGTGIIKKLGKKGIPGFISGKTWKMVIATFGYFLIFIILLAIISGSPEKTPSQQATPSTQVTTKTVASVSTPIPTPISYILIEYSTQTMDKIIAYDGYTYPPAGIQFLLFDFNVTNKAQKRILVNDFVWSLKVNTKENPNAYLVANRNFFGNEQNGIVCISAELDENGFTSCKALFEVPLNYEQYRISYDMAFDTPVKWIKYD